jgi:hypothetical protein
MEARRSMQVWDCFWLLVDCDILPAGLVRPPSPRLLRLRHLGMVPEFEPDEAFI